LKGVGVPEYYLGGNFDQITDPTFVNWNIMNALSASTYFGTCLEKFKRNLENLQMPPIIEQDTLMRENDHPKLDESPFLDDQRATLYQTIIGSSLNWMVTLGRLIHWLDSLLIRDMDISSEHAGSCLGYLQKYPKGRLLINPNHLDHSVLGPSSKHFDTWKEFYPDVEFPDLHDPPPLIRDNNRIQVSIFVDADFTHCHVMRRSVTGILVFVNGTPIKWYSKMQKTVETSTYGSEMVAAQIATEFALEFRYNIQEMLGFEI
jgi:hypothetical protein